MTARPLDPVRRRILVSAAVALVLVLAMVLVAGCIGCLILPTGCIEPAKQQDDPIIVVKLTSNATLEWSNELVSEGQNQVFGMILTPDNILAVYCTLKNESFHGLIEVSGKTGEIVWKTPLMSEYGCGPHIAQGNNGDIISAGGQKICRINPRGAVVWNRTTRLDGNIYSIKETSDGGYIAGGSKTDWYESGLKIVYDEYGNITPPLSQREKSRKGIPVSQTIVARFDAEGNVLWQTFLGRENLHDPAQVLIENGKGLSYSVQTESAIIRLDQNGKILNITRSSSLPEVSTAAPPGLAAKRCLNFPWDSGASPRVIFYDDRGSPVAKLTFQNVSNVVALTEDGGYVSAVLDKQAKNPHDPSVNMSKLNERLHIITLNSDGTKTSDMYVDGVSDNRVKGIMQTSDGGYLLIFGAA